MEAKVFTIGWDAATEAFIKYNDETAVKQIISEVRKACESVTIINPKLMLNTNDLLIDMFKSNLEKKGQTPESVLMNETKIRAELKQIGLDLIKLLSLTHYT